MIYSANQKFYLKAKGNFFGVNPMIRDFVAGFGGEQKVSEIRRRYFESEAAGYLKLVEYELGAEIIAGYSPVAGWQWAMRNPHTAKVTEVSESFIRSSVWRALIRHEIVPNPYHVRAVVAVTKFHTLHPEYRWTESGRVFPDVWTEDFFSDSGELPGTPPWVTEWTDEKIAAIGNPRLPEECPPPGRQQPRQQTSDTTKPETSRQPQRRHARPQSPAMRYTRS